MRIIPANFYARWRALTLAASSIHETADSGPVSERLLQLIWHHQRILRDQLVSLDGRPIKVLHPGFWNREAGPDFRGAVIQIGSSPSLHGDIEVDLCPHLWKGHHHAQNPAYRNVILHVVWEGEGGGSTALPTLSLKPFLDSPLDTLKSWLGRTPLDLFPDALIGQCAAPLRDLSIAAAHELLHQAAQVRLQAKASQFQARAQQAGWEQALWEGLFGALGYKHNAWPMRRLAEVLTPRVVDPGQSSSAFAWQARLLGTAGLLPGQLTGRQATADGHLRELWDIWWRHRDQFSEAVLPRFTWRFNGLRPANHPERRLALAAHWLASGDLGARLDRWFAAPVSDRELLRSLLEVLQVVGDGFWSRHWTLRSVRMEKPLPLLGPQRVTDLAINVILPWFWVRAVAGKNTASQELAERRYFSWPKAEDNSLLRLARKRLFGDRKVGWLATAADQQGLIQIVRDFCDHSDGLCENCRFPDLVRELRE